MTINLTNCAQNGLKINNYCTIAKPIYFSKIDRMSVVTEKAIIAHDETWEKLCN